jgi:sphingolipid 4-desaturase/C4-monooxygenase
MSSVPPASLPKGGFKVRFRLGMLGTPAPVFPGFEVDVCDPTPDGQKPDADWHNGRAREMLQSHPEIRSLMGRNPLTAVWCVLLAGIQVALAMAVGCVPWWLVIVLAYVAGAWLNLNLFMLAHECNHGLVFRSARWNRWLYTLTSLPMGQPAHHTWWIEHHTHHSDLGAKKDFIKRRRTFFLLTRHLTPLVFPYSLFMLLMQLVRSAVGLTLYLTGLLCGRVAPGTLTLAILADEHLVSGYRKHRLSGWAVVYTALGLALFAVVFAVAGWKGIVYLLLAQAFLTGFLHPLLFGMILSNSHFHGAKHYQPSSSYYGWLNRISFNFGLHTEHHDLARIPWNRLPALRRMAPDFYEPLHQTTSYVRLAMQFLFGTRETFERQFDQEEHRNAAMLGKAAGPHPVGES